MKNEYRDRHRGIKYGKVVNGVKTGCVRSTPRPPKKRINQTKP